jgi:hypothetical protein
MSPSKRNHFIEIAKLRLHHSRSDSDINMLQQIAPEQMVGVLKASSQ